LVEDLNMAELIKVIKSGVIFQETSMTDNSDFLFFILFFIDKDLLPVYGSDYSRDMVFFLSYT
jgi:hypothetical protein